jgi:competence protein ComFC
MTGPARPVYRLHQWLWSGIDLLYPPQCGGCGRKGDRWCVDCRSKAQLIQPPICNRCGQGLESGNQCVRCRKSPPNFVALRSWAGFTGPVRTALHQLKYRRDIALGERLAEPLSELYVAQEWSVDFVAPVPLGIARLKERGYNQAALIARPLALACGLPYESHALERTRETRSQVGLSLDERKINVANAFKAKSATVSSKNVLLVDDVATSSATLDACSRALLKAGATQVYCLTLARALYLNNVSSG